MAGLVPANDVFRVAMHKVDAIEGTDTMNKNKITRRSLALCLPALALCPLTSVQAQTWPIKPVRFLVGFGAGGNIDNVARLTAQRLSDVFGQQFFVENRVGANGTLAA